MCVFSNLWAKLHWSMTDDMLACNIYHCKPTVFQRHCYVFLHLCQGWRARIKKKVEKFHVTNKSGEWQQALHRYIRKCCFSSSPSYWKVLKNVYICTSHSVDVIFEKPKRQYIFWDGVYARTVFTSTGSTNFTRYPSGFGSNASIVVSSSYCLCNCRYCTINAAPLLTEIAQWLECSVWDSHPRPSSYEFGMADHVTLRIFQEE